MMVAMVVLALGLALMLPVPVEAAIAYVALQGGVWRLYVQSGLSEAPRSISIGFQAGDVSSPALSPDGLFVSVETGRGIMVCSVSVSQECKSVPSQLGAMVRPAWHPVSAELVFSRYVADGKEEVAQILRTRGRLSYVEPLLAQTGVLDDPAVSPDGRLLAYTASQTISVHKAGVEVVQQIWIADTVTGRVRQLVCGTSRDTYPTWAPAGGVMAFASDRSGDFEIWTIDVDGTGLRRLTSGPGTKTRPRWSPDGKSIMFTMAREGRLSLWIIDADGSNLRQFEPFGPNADVQLRDADWR